MGLKISQEQQISNHRHCITNYQINQYNSIVTLRHIVLIQMIIKFCFGGEIHVGYFKANQTYNQVIHHIRSAFKKIPQHFALKYEDQDGDFISICHQTDLQSLYGLNLKKVKIYIEEVAVEEYVEAIENSANLHQCNEDGNIKVPESDCQDLCIQDFLKQLVFPPTQNGKQINPTIQEQIVQNKQEIVPNVIIQIKDQEIVNQATQKTLCAQNKQIKKQKFIHKLISCNGCDVYSINGIRYMCPVCEKYNLCEQCQKKIEHIHPFLKIKNDEQTPQGISIKFKQAKKQQEDMQYIQKVLPIGCLEIQEEVKGGTQSSKRIKQELKIQSLSCQLTQSFVEQQQDNTSAICQQEQEHIYISAAHQICELMESAEFSKSYLFAKNFPGKTKQQIISKFFSDKFYRFY